MWRIVSIPGNESKVRRWHIGIASIASSRRTMGFVKEFKEFAVKGNVVDMAVGIIIGAAFGKIVSSLVADVIMPPIGVIIGGVNFTGLKVPLKQGAEGVAAVTLNYGTFLQNVFDFTIVAFALFVLVRAINRLKQAEPPAPEKISKEAALLSEIRDLLRERRAA